jgi:hypothetical protein
MSTAASSLDLAQTGRAEGRPYKTHLPDAQKGVPTKHTCRDGQKVVPSAASEALLYRNPSLNPSPSHGRLRTKRRGTLLARRARFPFSPFTGKGSEGVRGSGRRWDGQKVVRPNEDKLKVDCEVGYRAKRADPLVSPRWRALIAAFKSSASNWQWLASASN